MRRQRNGTTWSARWAQYLREGAEDGALGALRRREPELRNRVVSHAKGEEVVVGHKTGQPDRNLQRGSENGSEKPLVALERGQLRVAGAPASRESKAG